MTAETDAGFDPAATLDQISAATAQVLDTAAQFTDADARAPSLLPNWSRGHVLTHLARNADGGRRLLIWARTGVEMAEYPSVAARAEEIEAGQVAAPMSSWSTSATAQPGSPRNTAGCPSRHGVAQFAGPAVRSILPPAPRIHGCARCWSTTSTWAPATRPRSGRPSSSTPC